MNWIKNVVRPKIQKIWKKNDIPENLWIKCPETGQIVHHEELKANQFVIPNSGYHMKMPARYRLESLFDDEEYEVLSGWKAPTDPLKFRDKKKYIDRVKEAKSKAGMDEAAIAAHGKLDGIKTVILVQDFSFLGGSLGTGTGAAIIHAMEMAVELEAPFILIAASGGARMQEGILSLMQMPRTTIAVQKLKEANLPYIVVLTNPTTGGVTASYAMLGDVHIAEPGALICFAGPRVIEQTIREQLPDGFQKSEYLQEHGMVDMVVHRHKLKNMITNLIRFFTNDYKANVKVSEDELEIAKSDNIDDEMIDDEIARETNNAVTNGS